MKRYGYFMLLFQFFLLTGWSSAADTKVITAEAVYYKNDVEVRGYLARPDDDQKHPGLILIHEWWGLNDNIRKNAEKFAQLGYVALAIDLYVGKSTTVPDEARKLATNIRKNMDEAFRNMKRTVTFLSKHL